MTKLLNQNTAQEADIRELKSKVDSKVREISKLNVKYKNEKQGSEDMEKDAKKYKSDFEREKEKNKKQKTELKLAQEQLEEEKANTIDMANISMMEIEKERLQAELTNMRRDKSN